LTVPVYHANAFVHGSSVAGNAAAVVVLPAAGSAPPSAALEAWMQKVASQFNLSETAFLQPLPAGSPGDYGLKWFTPKKEVALCGHATLAAAHVLFHECRAAATSCIRFKTRSGVLEVRNVADESITMRFPLNAPAPPESSACTAAYDSIAEVALESLLRAGPGAAATRLEDLLHETAYNSATGKLILRLRDEDGYSLLASMAVPLSSRLLGVDQSHLSAACRVSGVSVTALAPGGNPWSAHFASRYFSPWNGIAEDPVNGSSHTILAPFWAERLGLWRAESEGSTAAKSADMTAVQLSRSPAGGVLRLRAIASTVEGESAVEIGGASCTIYAGRMAGPMP
jgi:predicted PhzF superfamily epimerase YddE/YHI9